MISISQFKNIPKEFRINYVANTIHQRGDNRLYRVVKESDLILEAMNKSFTWMDSPQGHDFWFRLTHEI